ncbi:uncharacterized protein LOC121730127 isoform X2 [Aricia agestis]|uniref:uncharacterized protein LOC121730127 isoform X2 n=1 Tax=Aricia agestis TaxID=91739 RepID=UPI001C20BEAA|nr:uncharacterized protein LOC121730127 isoform X2 [Aricia agestis]
MNLKIFVFNLIVFTAKYAETSSNIPILSLEHKKDSILEFQNSYTFIPFNILMGQNNDTTEFWRETEILSLVRKKETNINYDKCKTIKRRDSKLHIPSRRLIRPICRSTIDFQQCPQCPRLTNFTECELFRDSCKERRVLPSEYQTYCDQKYGKWRTKFFAAEYNQCQCCDDCVYYRDFRAGCNPYLDHPEQELRALRCDTIFRRCVPASTTSLPNETLYRRHIYRFESIVDVPDCPISCRGFVCQDSFVKEQDCVLGSFRPDKTQCNCCGKCSAYFQLNQKCAELKKTVHKVNGSKEIEVEEEFLDPGCDDGLVCRDGVCQDIHRLGILASGRRAAENSVYEPCREEVKYFIKKYGKDGHLHYDAPQCTPLWLYAPVQCRRFVCYCALEDGTFVEGIKVPRAEVSNMNCDCARERCRTGSDMPCDGYGNYVGVQFSIGTRDLFVDETK